MKHLANGSIFIFVYLKGQRIKVLRDDSKLNNRSSDTDGGDEDLLAAYSGFKLITTD